MNEVNIWAKSRKKDGNPISLLEHTKDVLTIFDKIKHRMASHLYDPIRLAIVCHDWGKILPAFQIRTMKNHNYRPSSPSTNIPHSFLSVLFINENKIRDKIADNDYREFLFSAIAYHHWRENFFELISSYSNELAEFCEELERQGKINELEKNLQEEIKKLGGGWQDLIKFNIEMAKGLRNGVPFFEYVCPPYQLYFLPKRAGIDDKKLRDWILIAGFLQRADHFASFCEEEDLNNVEPELSPVNLDTTKNQVKLKIQEKVPNIELIWQLKKIVNYKDKNLILIAPTGYGKTEFAFLWGSGEKFFYTLPLRAAVNQIYKRATGIFGTDKSGLLHSDADVFLLGDGGEGQASLKTYDLARQLAFPAIISTGDQFFPYALRPPGYEKIYSTFSYSRLVIDEVQAYDPRAAAIVVKFIEDVTKMGGKFLLMTATLPEFVREEIKETIGEGNLEEINLYEDNKKEFEKIKKHKIKVELIKNSPTEEKIDFSLPDEKLKEVLDKAKEGKRVLVIANTVKQAQDIFEKIKKIDSHNEYSTLKDKVWLLHSRFTLEDRKQKEKEIQDKFINPKPNNESEGKILVATQVVEASLDIDADVLFTEIAPMDALVQRMGRVLRRYGPQRMGRVLRRYGPMSPPSRIPTPTEPNVFVWVFENELQSGRGYVYETDLVLLTLKLMKDKSTGQGGNEIKEWFKQKKKEAKNDANQLISLVVKKCFYNEQSAHTQRRRQPKGANNVNPASAQDFEFVCSEYDKYGLVKTLYESLPEESRYLMKFQQAKDILDAGYMSDRKEEAREIFREIFNISIIPETSKENFKKEITSFLNNNRKKPGYTMFKKNVLAKFVVDVPRWGIVLDRRVSDVLSVEYDWDKNINKDNLEKIKRWCRDIYFYDLEYDEQMGLKLFDNRESNILLL